MASLSDGDVITAGVVTEYGYRLNSNRRAGDVAEGVMVTRCDGGGVLLLSLTRIRRVLRPLNPSGSAASSPSAAVSQPALDNGDAMEIDATEPEARTAAARAGWTVVAEGTNVKAQIRNTVRAMCQNSASAEDDASECDGEPSKITWNLRRQLDRPAVARVFASAMNAYLHGARVELGGGDAIVRWYRPAGGWLGVKMCDSDECCQVRLSHIRRLMLRCGDARYVGEKSTCFKNEFCKLISCSSQTPCAPYL